MSTTWAGMSLESYSKEELIKIVEELIAAKRKQDNEFIKILHSHQNVQPTIIMQSHYINPDNGL